LSLQHRLGPQAVIKTYKGAEHTEILTNDAVIKTYEGAEHTEILTNDAAVADLLDILTEDFRVLPAFLRRFWGSLPSFRSRGQFQ